MVGIVIGRWSGGVDGAEIAQSAAESLILGQSSPGENTHSRIKNGPHLRAVF